MNLGKFIFYGLVQLFLAWQGTCEDTYDIPVTFNALLQESVPKSGTVNLFYDMDKNFYSKVTVIDAARNAQELVKETIKKSIGVLFLTVASSHVSKTLTLSDLQYTAKSKWSYTVNVESILRASQGTLTKIELKTVIYKIQENAMKVLEERFKFQSSEILNRLNLESTMDYFAVDEARWIEVVGIIVEKVISNRSEILHLTTCYLADMINITEDEIQGFTLNQIDKYLYNATTLLEKLPDYRNNVLERLYQTFSMTPTDMAKISNTKLSEIDTMILNDVLKLFTDSVLKKLRVTKNEITEKDSSFDAEMILSCTSKWQPFKTIVIPESFDNSAETMALEVETLSSLINIPYFDIQQLTINEMIDLLETTIDPLSTDKKLVEATQLSGVLQLYTSKKIDNKKDNVFEVIYRFTNFTERKLTILYGWTPEDYTFSSMFTLEETNDVCKINSLEYDLLALAKLAIGQEGDIQCQSFSVLREIWDNKSVSYLESKYSSGEQLSLDMPISMLVNQLTKAPSRINNRVLNVTSETEKLISNLSIDNITAVTTYSSSYLQTMSFQDIIGIIVHLKRNGSFDHKIQVVSHFILTSLTPSLMFTPTHIHTTNENYSTTTKQKPHTISEVSPDSNKDSTLPLSGNRLKHSSPRLLKEPTSIFHMTQNTIMPISINQTNATIFPKQHTTGSKMYQSPSSSEYLNTVSISIAQSKILPTLRFRSTIPLLVKASLSANYSSNESYLTSTTRTNSKNHPNEFIFTSTWAMISSTNDLNTSKTVIDQGDYKTSIVSTKTERTMTQQTHIASNVTEIHISREFTDSLFVINATISSTSKYLEKLQTITSRIHFTYNISTVLQTTKYPNSMSVRKSHHSKISLLKTATKLSLNISSSKTLTLDSTNSSVQTNHTNVPLNTQNLLTETILSSNSKMESSAISLKPTLTTTVSDKTFRITSQNIIPYTSSTKVMVNTARSSPAMAGIDASSKGDMFFSSRANTSSQNMISLVIQTSRIESTMPTSVQSSIPLVTSSMPTTKLISDKISSSIKSSTKIQISSTIEASSTINVFASSTVTSIEESPAKTLSTNSNQPTHSIRDVVKSSLKINSPTTTPYVKTSSPYISTSALPTPRISSQLTKMSTTLLATSLTSFAKPSTTKSRAFSASVQNPVLTCQPECKAEEFCVLNSGTAICKAAQNLEGNFRITSGANFTKDLENKNSETFKKLAKQIEEMIDSIYKSSQYLSNYLGVQVLKFEQGSVIVLYKVSFENTLDLSADTVQNIAQVFSDANDTSFTIDNSSISFQDFDECSSGQATKCYKTATCNNTLGSYICICPKGMTGDGASCQVVNSAKQEDKEEVPWIIYVVIAIMVVLIIFLIVVIIYCEKKHKKKQRPQVLDFYNGGINMYPRSTSYLAQTPESEADLADGLGIVNRHGPPLNMVTFNPTPEDKKEIELQKGQPGMLLSFKRIDPD